jgi:hypothetical protein
MGDTFGGEWHRPHGTRSGKDRQRGYSQRELQDRASYDNQPQTSYSGCLLIAFTILAALAAALGVVLG